MILFCVLFGLSMDYEVFLLSRMKEVWDRTGDNQEAVARGLERSGRIVTSAALIVVVVAGVVRVRRHRPDQGARASGMAIAVALDATVVRALLVPATMRLLGPLELVAPAALAALAPVLPLIEADVEAACDEARHGLAPRRRAADAGLHLGPDPRRTRRRRCPAPGRRRRAAPRPPDPQPVVLPARRRARTTG